MGEGEDTFHHLMRLLDECGSLPPEKLEDVPGIVFHRDGRTAINRERESLEDSTCCRGPTARCCRRSSTRT
jgi:radical SAM superfamily enzyme YgiQ (UPF0313 family)